MESKGRKLANDVVAVLVEFGLPRMKAADGTIGALMELDQDIAGEPFGDAISRCSEIIKEELAAKTEE